MGLKPINRICPHCGNGNYMRLLEFKNVGKLNVKCINCNSYYNYDELNQMEVKKRMELEPCPFCGGEAFLRRLYTNYIIDAKHDDNCPMQILPLPHDSHWVTRLAAESAWNRRGDSGAMTIDKIDNDKGYSPDNCQWLTKSENSIKMHRERGRRIGK